MTVVAAGSHIFAVLPWRETHRINSNTWTGNAGIDLLRYDIPTDRWTVLRDAGQHVQGLDGAVWTGRELITTAAPRICVASCPWTPALPGQRYDPATGGWTPLPRGPVDDLRPHTLWTGAALLAFDTGTYTSGPNGTTYAGAAAVWDPHANRWTRLAGAPYASVGNAAAVWASDRLLEWGEMTMPRDRRGGTSTVGLSYG